MTFKPITIDPHKRYGQCLSDAINLYWRARVCTYEGMWTDEMPGRTIMKTRDGIPLGVMHHADIVRCQRVPGTNNWKIIDDRTEGRRDADQRRDSGTDARKALSRRAEVRRRIEEEYRAQDSRNAGYGRRHAAE